MADTILREDADGVRVLTLNRPAVMNALDAALRRDLLAALWGRRARDARS